MLYCSSLLTPKHNNSSPSNTQCYRYFCLKTLTSRSAISMEFRFLNPFSGHHSHTPLPIDSSLFGGGGLFLESGTPPVAHLIPLESSSRPVVFCGFGQGNGCGFMSVSLRSNGCVQNKVKNGDKGLEEAEEASAVVERGKKRKVRVSGNGAINTTKHLWAGAIAAMVARTCVAPLERLKLEYMVRGEQKKLFELIKTIAVSQGLKGFWKGNLVNILRTAPFKAINFCAFDTYRKQLLKFSGNDETTNFERLISGAAAGVTATVLCLPLDTIRTKLVAPGGESLGGVIGTFHHLIRTEGVFSLYKGLVPSILSMAPAAAVFYSVYDILKSAYLHSPQGRKRIQNMNEQGQELNALDQLELGPVRTLLYGAIAGACAEAVTYPFEVVRRQLQLQNQVTRLTTLATCVKIVEHGGIPALYVGLIPSLLQVLPSASIGYFVYEFMKIVLKVE